MKTKNILNKKFTTLSSLDGYYHHQGLTDYTQTNLTLNQILYLGNKYKEQINILRQMEYHSEEQREFKEKFPCWFVGGIFPFEKLKDENILEYSNVLAIDIDKKDNPNIDLNEIAKKIFELPYVFMVSKSISGQGIYVLVLLEDGIYTKEYYTYLTKLWTKQYNIKIDEQCKNIGRKRFISYDDNIMIKDDEIEINEWKLKSIIKEPSNNETKKSQPYCGKYKTVNTNQGLVSKAIWYLLNNRFSIDNFNAEEPYATWYHIGCDFRHFDDGEQMFIKFSTNSTKYFDNITNILKKWNQTKKEISLDEVSKKWCGMCKRIYGKQWYNKINESNNIF